MSASDDRAGTSGIHPAPMEFSAEQVGIDPILHFFHYGHLPPVLQAVSARFCTLANFIVSTLPRNPERTVALRKLLEAKDAAVRANVGVKAGSAPVASADTFETRLLAERSQLMEREEKLRAFLAGEQAGASPTQVGMLIDQHLAMCMYLDALSRRCIDLGLIDVPVSELDRDFPVVGEVKETGGHDSDRDGPVPFGT